MTPNQDRPYDVYGVGNALVDILAQVDDDFVASFQLPKGAMTLMDSMQQASVLQQLETQALHLASGGSAANTMIALAQSGGNGFYAGKVAHDPHGEFYRQDMNDAGIEFEVEPAPEAGDPTGSCVVLTTPDAERTMCTHLGVSTTLHADDIDSAHIAQSKYSYIEGYLWDSDEPRAACIRAMDLSRQKQTLVAFTVSDAFLIDRYAREFHEMIPRYCDVLFCNSYEARQLCETDSLDDCVQKLGKLAPLVFMTESEQGCRVIRRSDVQSVEGFPVKAIDTVGAGDAFAGGVLYGLTNSMDPLKAARWGNYMASHVVSIIGPRLRKSMETQMAEVISV